MSAINLDEEPQGPFYPLPCTRIDDLYGGTQRRTIRLATEGWLRRYRLTVNEFMHSAGALQRFEAAGMPYQHAVQRVAVTLASRSKVPVVEFIKALNALAGAAIGRVYKDEEAGLFPQLKADGLAAHAAALAGDPRASYLLNGALAKYLEPASSWDEKLALLLALYETSQGSGVGEALVLGVADGAAAEIVGDEFVLKELLGGELALKDSLLLVIRILQGAADGPLEGVAESLRRLADYLARGEFPAARRALGRYVLECLQSSVPLVAGALDAEFKAMRQMVASVGPLYGSLFDPADFSEAFAQRGKRFTSQEALFKLTETAKRPDEKLMRLLELEAQLEGNANKRALAPFALAFLTAHNFEDEFAAGAPGTQRLRRLADLQRRILKSSFPEGVRDKMAGILDAIAIRVESEGRLFAGLEGRFGDPAERVDMIMKLFENGVFTQGNLGSKARRAILAGIAQPGFLEAYTAPRKTNRQTALLELVAQLKQIGISPEESVRAMSPA